MNKKIIISLATATLFLLPLATFAVNVDNIPTPQGTLTTITNLVNPILNLMWQVFISLAFIMVLIAAFLFLTANGDPGKLASARQALIWAAVAIGIGIAAFSIPFIVRNMFPNA